MAIVFDLQNQVIGPGAGQDDAGSRIQKDGGTPNVVAQDDVAATGEGKGRSAIQVGKACLGQGGNIYCDLTLGDTAHTVCYL